MRRISFRSGILPHTVLMLAGDWLLAGEQPPTNKACRFTLTGETTKAAITGPEDIVWRVHIVPQPESPVEITAIQFEEGTEIWFSNGWLTRGLCYKVKVRNRSDRFVHDVRVYVVLLLVPQGTKGGASVTLSRHSSTGIAPGQETQFFGGCGGAVRGTTPHGNYRLLPTVEWVNFPGCRYYPPLHISHLLRTGMSNPQEN